MYRNRGRTAEARNRNCIQKLGQAQETKAVYKSWDRSKQQELYIHYTAAETEASDKSCIQELYT